MRPAARAGRRGRLTWAAGWFESGRQHPVAVPQLQHGAAGLPHLSTCPRAARAGARGSNTRGWRRWSGIAAPRLPDGRLEGAGREIRAREDDRGPAACGALGHMSSQRNLQLTPTAPNLASLNAKTDHGLKAAPCEHFARPLQKPVLGPPSRLALAAGVPEQHRRARVGGCPAAAARVCSTIRCRVRRAAGRGQQPLPGVRREGMHASAACPAECFLDQPVQPPACPAHRTGGPHHQGMACPPGSSSW